MNPMKPMRQCVLRGLVSTPALLVAMMGSAFAAAPVAVHDYFAYPKTATTPLDVLKNDSDADGDPLTIVGVSGHGLSISPDGRSLLYDGARGAHQPSRPYVWGSYGVSDGTTTTWADVGLSTARRAPKLPPPIPDASRTNSAVIDPVNNFFDYTHIDRDSHQQKQRVDITFTNPNDSPFNIAIYLFPSAGFSYRVTPDMDPVVCVPGVYNVPLNPWVFEGAIFLGFEKVLGRKLERWGVRTELTKDVYTGRRRTIDGAKVFVPYSIESRAISSPNSVATFLWYSDVVVTPTGLPDQSVFDLPAACTP